jgi:hypothetical protein
LTAKIAANRRKAAKIKWLAFAFFYFSVSRLFNGLRPIQTRKFHLPVPASGRRAAGKVRSGEWEGIAQNSDFRKIFASLAHPARLRALKSESGTSEVRDRRKR